MPGRGVQIQEDGPTACTQESPSLVKGAGMRSQSVTVRRFESCLLHSSVHRLPVSDFHHEGGEFHVEENFTKVSRVRAQTADRFRERKGCGEKWILFLAVED